jgi:hypothetical protein
MFKLNVSEARKAWEKFKKEQPKYAEALSGKYQFGKFLDKYAATSQSVVKLGTQYMTAYGELERMLMSMAETVCLMEKDLKKNPNFSREEAKKLDDLLKPVWVMVVQGNEQAHNDAVALRKILPVI